MCHHVVHVCLSGQRPLNVAVISVLHEVTFDLLMVSAVMFAACVQFVPCG